MWQKHKPLMRSAVKGFKWSNVYNYLPLYMVYKTAKHLKTGQK